MKKFTFALILFGTIALLSLKDNEVCPGVAGHKALACSACHGGSISGDVFIIDGKVEDTEEEENTFEYVVRVPTSTLNFLQLATSIRNDISTTSRVKVNFASLLFESKGSTLFNAVNLSQKKSNKDFTEFIVSYSVDEPLLASRTIVLEGVLSNNDGTVHGDQTFYREIIVEPKEDNIEAINQSVSRDRAFYNNNQVNVSNPGKIQVVNILDLQGKLVHSVKVEEYQNIDVSSLVKGVYLVLIGNGTEYQNSFKFVK